MPHGAGQEKLNRPAQPARRADVGRQKARAAMNEAIVTVARAQLAKVGPAQLSTRAVAREVGVVSSAIFRYFPTRDALLTELIVRAYQDLGAAAEAADASHPRADLRERFTAVFFAARQWARANPHEWGLLYGTPVPGYQAPDITTGPASRLLLVLVGVLADLDTARQRGSAPEAPAAPPLRIEPAALEPARTAAPFADDRQLALGMLAWTWMYGAISAELWGHLADSVADPAEFYRAAVEFWADALGLPPSA